MQLTVPARHRQLTEPPRHQQLTVLPCYWQLTAPPRHRQLTTAPRHQQLTAVAVGGTPQIQAQVMVNRKIICWDWESPLLYQPAGCLHEPALAGWNLP